MAFKRKDIIAKLKGKISRKEPIIASGAGAGLVAKMQDLHHIDFTTIYHSGVFRLDGAPGAFALMPYGDGNTMMLDLARRVLPRVKNTPLVAGVGAVDPYRDPHVFAKELIDMGFSGIINFPTCGGYEPEFFNHLNDSGIGYDEEIAMIAWARKNDIFTVAYAFTEDQLKGMVGAGVDVICPHLGLTAGGLIGAEDAVSLDKGCKEIQKLYDLAIKGNPDVIVLFHGGPFYDPETTQYAFSHTDIHGLLGGSAIERIPIENAILDCVKSFKALKLR